jgi:cytochrome c oxidase assembly protein subunit 17
MVISGIESNYELNEGSDAPSVNANDRDKGSASPSAADTSSDDLQKSRSQDLPLINWLIHSAVDVLIEFVTMPFGWFSAPSKPAPSPQVETSPAAKSNWSDKNCLTVDRLNPEGLKPCCACPITKQKRDDCFMKSANGDVECQGLIQAHRE